MVLQHIFDRDVESQEDFIPKKVSRHILDFRDLTLADLFGRNMATARSVSDWQQQKLVASTTAAWGLQWISKTTIFLFSFSKLSEQYFD